MKKIYYEPGFISSLPPVPGGLEAIAKMADRGHDVFICTSPLLHYDNCISEKYEWVEENLDMDWTKKIILTKDKTLVSGNILIDDKPKITCVQMPKWEHIVFDKPYNKNAKDKWRITWDDWEDFLDCYEYMPFIKHYM